MLIQGVISDQSLRPIVVEMDCVDRPLYHVSKRVVDFVLATLLLIALAPLFLLIVVLIRRDTPGPALFVQERVGSRRRIRDGKVVWEAYTFRMYKFRSMVRNADEAVHQAYIKAFIEGRKDLSAQSGGVFKLNNDPRVTPVGRVLRKTSLDELPQLINVLKGEMSLVGPRPVPIYEVLEYQPQHYQRLAALPGITGLWQVEGRARVTFEQMVEMDVTYTRTQSLRFDMMLILLTVWAVFSSRGAS
jgi:lipopolysaccharide/colanic/teichoic acid biosynthesis glycosyltransferase